MTRFALPLVGLFLAGCISVPILPELTPEQLALTVNAPRRGGLLASITCVQDGVRYQQPCDMALKEAMELLGKSHWFARIAADEDSPDVRLTVHAPVRRPYYTRPPHNPAALFLSIAIPFWWDEPMGLRIDATRVETGKTVTVDLTREGTIIFWSAAGLFNVLPTRAFMTDEQGELDHLHLQLLPLYGSDS